MIKRYHCISGIFFASFIILFLSVPQTQAQDVTGNLEGRIIDTTGRSLADINIILSGKNLQGDKGTATDSKGYFRFTSLPVGRYSIKITGIGYSRLKIEETTVQLGKTTSLGEITLKQQAVNLPEITVSGKKPVIDPVSTSYGGNINAEDFRQLPIDRNYRNMAAVLPQVNTSYYGDEANIGGATGFENKYFVDGVEVTDPLIARDATNLPYNFIQEIEVNTGGYGVDSRSSSGGLINVITYSGSNEFHGSVFGFYTSNQLTENKKIGSLDITQGNFSDYDFGFGLGGPVIRDYLWFYAAYNPTFNRRDVEVPGFGNYVDKTITHALALKLSWRASENLNLVFTGTGNPTYRDAVGRNIDVPPSALSNPDPYLQTTVEGGVNYSLNASYKISKNISINGMISRVDRHDTGEGTTDRARNEVQYRDFLTDTWAGGVDGSWNSFRHSTGGRIFADILLGNHSVTGGAEYKTNSVSNIYDIHRVIRYMQPDSSIYFGESIDKGFGEVSNHIPSVFLQDSWRIFERLSVTAGLRWDGNYIVGSDNKVDQVVSVPLQPRIGFAFLPGDNVDQRIYGSFGRFTQEFALFQSVNFYSENGYNYFIRFDHDPRVDNTGGDTLKNVLHMITPEINDLQSQYYDEFSLGYERAVGWNIKAGIQGVYRILRQAIDDVYLPEENRYQIGNPGRGILSDWPKARRDYEALILSVQRSGDEHFNFIASYVLSRNYGNYEGLFDAITHGSFPNQNIMFDDLSNARINTTGLVPNDRTHVFKFSGYYNLTFGLTAGLSFVAQSGTPLGEYALTNYGIRFLVPRGSAGRTPAVWDLNARLLYNINFIAGWNSRLILDFFHIAGQHKPVYIDQRKYFSTDENGNPSTPNNAFGQAYRYQPSMSVRLGMEVGF